MLKSRKSNKITHRLSRVGILNTFTLIEFGTVVQGPILMFTSYTSIVTSRFNLVKKICMSRVQRRVIWNIIDM